MRSLKRGMDTRRPCNHLLRFIMVGTGLDTTQQSKCFQLDILQDYLPLRMHLLCMCCSRFEMPLSLESTSNCIADLNAVDQAPTDAYSTRQKEPYIIEQRIHQCVVKECPITPKSNNHWPSSVNIVALVDGIHIIQRTNF